MPASNSTVPPAPSNPTKPQRPEGSPLFWHATGRWAKKIRGKLVYFTGTHDEAIAAYEEQKEALHSGRAPRDQEGLTVYMLCARFLEAKKSLREAGELSPLTFRDYGDVCKRILKAFGRNRMVADLHPEDFGRLRAKMGKTWGPVRLKAQIVKTRVPFNWAWKNRLIDRPLVFGDDFTPPSRKVIRQHKQARGPKLFEVAELRAMLKKATLPLRAMLLLGVQAGFGNTDIGNVPLAALDLDAGWIDFPRAKTGIARRAPLWPETVQAIREWLAVRPKPKAPRLAPLLFLTCTGDTWAQPDDNPLSKETRKLLDALDLNGHRNFYCCRHTFQTIGDESGDFLAVRRIMGHASNDIADEYRERISDERLRKVTDHVRRWLFVKGRKTK